MTDQTFDDGVQHTVELLAKWLSVDHFEMADGSEDHDTDLGNTLLNILHEKGLYDREEACTVADPRPIKDYHEDMGPVLWWWWVPANYQGEGPAHWAGEPPYCGTPNDLGFTVEAHTTTRIITQSEQEHDPAPHIERINVGGWPGYHTHFTPLPKVKQP